MSEAPTLGLAIIARDEEESLPGLLASIEGVFDQVVLVDTGSKDGTVEVFREWARRPFADTDEFVCKEFKVGHFTWVDDFSAARNYAHSLLDTDWECWADADDELHGAENLRTLAAEAPPHVAAFAFDYDYAHDPHGNVICRLRRERLVRRGAGRWHGAVHEAQRIEGQQVLIPPEQVKWVHRKREHGLSGGRNLRILRRWARQEPDNPRVLAYLGAEELGRGRHKIALRHYRRYMRLKAGWDEERAQVHRRAALCYAALGDQEAAERLALEAVALLPTWTDSYLTLAEIAYQRGEWAKAGHWAQEVLRLGEPQTMLITDPSGDYVIQPRVLLAGALAQLGRLDDAIRVAEEALEHAPDLEALLGPYAHWRAGRKREQVAETFTKAAKVLIAHDEQLKALDVLWAVPHFSFDHPDVVALRSELRERVDHLHDDEGYTAHYHDASPIETFIPDEQVLEIGDSIPRAHFMLEQVREMAGVAA